jgi:hypothetical protein
MLSRRDRSVLDTLLPSGAHPALALGVFDAGFDAFYAEFEREADIRLRAGFRAALWAACWLGPMLIRRLPPLTRLSREDRERAVGALYTSGWYLVRQMGLILKAVTSFAYAGDPRVRDAMGYPEQFDDPRTHKDPEALRGAAIRTDLVR